MFYDREFFNVYWYVVCTVPVNRMQDQETVTQKGQSCWSFISIHCAVICKQELDADVASWSLYFYQSSRTLKNMC